MKAKAKEKAQDLISKMNIIHYTKLIKASLPISMYDDQIKGCALIAVDELIKETSFEVPNIRQRYWEEVKQELLSL